MSIQRHGPIISATGKASMYAESQGRYVTYADHLAEVERVLNGEWTGKVFSAMGLFDAARHDAAEAMRAACIAAVEAVQDDILGETDNERVLTALREVQP